LREGDTDFSEHDLRCAVPTKWKEWFLGDRPKSFVGWILVVSALVGLIAFILFLVDRCSGGNGIPKASISIRVGSEWDTKTFENSHWGALLSWATAGDMASCRLSDDQGSLPEYVPTDRRQPKRYGSYARSVTAVRLHLHCEGPHDADASRTATQPDGPALHPRLLVHRSRWLGRSGATHWEARLTYSGGSMFAVKCSLRDNVNQSDYQKDPSGETTGYGDFSRSVARVKIYLKCSNVADVEFVTDPVTALRPRR
jgi:hypothetical protein